MTLNASSRPQSDFLYWTGDCALEGHNTRCNVVMSRDISVGAVFVPSATRKVTLKVTKGRSNGGTGRVESDDGSITCGGTCSNSYHAGAPVVLSAVADGGSTFIGWKPDSLGCAGTAPCVVTMEEALTVTAVFGKSEEGQ